MSSQDNGYKSSTIWQLLLVIPGTILVLTLLISLLAKSFSGAAPETAPAAEVAKVEENIKPVAEVEMAAADAGPHVDKSGEEVVTAVCSMCHTAGLMNAPKIGDKAAWAPRIAQGYDTLVKNAINGIRGMPAKGGNAALSDNEVTNAMVHMANLGGANFKAVAASEAKAADAAPAEAAPAAVAVAVAAAPSEKTVAKEKVEAKVEKAAEVKAAEAAPAAAAGKSGKEVYTATCSMCHGTGLMNAPKFGDKGQWEPRIAQGYDTLVKNATNGIRTMPAKGGNASLSDAEVADAVKYMANEAGAGF
ncbi:MAG TPA: c-type cytochrome [Methylotenera sp.]|nr:c-type cytochrome [Methylotenera sp.]HPH05613.1 c-type cytochrome [Methylotenera sp.]